MSDLNRIAVFAQVVSAGSFSAGAKTLGIPKSSASRSVKQLEDALGVRLLERTTRRLRLTGAGQEYYERVASALTGLEEARVAVTEMQETLKGVIRLAAPTAWGSWLLAPIIAGFVEQHPEVHIDLSLVDRDIDLVRDGFDLALRMGRLDDSSLIVRTMGTVDRGLFASNDYLARRGTPVRVADLADHEFIICHTDGNGHRLRLVGPDGPETVAVKGAVATDSSTFVHEAVRHGLGIGMLPVTGCVAHFRLARVLPEHGEPGMACSLVYPSSRYLPQRVALLRDTLLEHLHPRFADHETLMPCAPGDMVSGATPQATPLPESRKAVAAKRSPVK
jgi:DNA-binding transcriptional LysR family regulator